MFTRVVKSLTWVTISIFLVILLLVYFIGLGFVFMEQETFKSEFFLCWLFLPFVIYFFLGTDKYKKSPDHIKNRITFLLLIPVFIYSIFGFLYSVRQGRTTDSVV